MGALSAGVGSLMAIGKGADRAGALTTDCLACGLTGEVRLGGAGDCGKGGATSGCGGSINCDISATGTTSSTARINNPLYRAHMKPTCSNTTDKAIAALRLMVGTGDVMLRNEDGEITNRILYWDSTTRWRNVGGWYASRASSAMLFSLANLIA